MKHFFRAYWLIVLGIVVVTIFRVEILIFGVLPPMPDETISSHSGIVDFMSGIVSKLISPIFVGDIMLDRGVKAKVQATQNGNYEFPFAKIAWATRAADLTIGNLEGSLSNKGTDGGKPYSFRMDPVRGRGTLRALATSNGMDMGAIQGLTFAGFDVLTTANNHSGDWGRPALEDTIANIESAGILPIGAGLNRGQAYAPAIFNIRRTKLAFLGFSDFMGLTSTNTTSGIAVTNNEDMAHAIQNAKRHADLVFVCFHFGVEYQTTSTARQRELAHEAIDDGADMVVGSHPHVIEPMEEYKGKPIAYSLGNFIFDQNFSSSTMSGELLNVIIRNKKIENVNLKLLHINRDFQPELVSGS